MSRSQQHVEARLVHHPRRRGVRRRRRDRRLRLLQVQAQGESPRPQIHGGSDFRDSRGNGWIR